MSERIDRDDLEVDEQMELSPYMVSLIESLAHQLGYIMPAGAPTKRTRFELALEMDRNGLDPLYTAEVLAGKRVGIKDPDLVMLAYAYKCGKMDRRDFFMRFCTEADLLALL